MSDPDQKKPKHRKQMARRRAKPSVGEIVAVATVAVKAVKELYEVAKPHLARFRKKKVKK